MINIVFIRGCVFCLLLFFSSTAYSSSAKIAAIQQKIFHPDSQFTTIALNFDKTVLKKIKSAAGVRVKQKRIQAWKVQRDKRDMGWFFIDKVIGKHELITYAIAIDTHNLIKGLEIIEYLETHGGEVQQQKWRQQFIGKNLVNSRLKLGKDIDGISGATLSSRNITDGVRKLLLIKELLESMH